MSTALHVVPPLRHRPELRAELVGDGAALRALEPEWSALCQSARAGCLFLAPEWLLPWWDCFGAGDSSRELRCISIRADGKLIGFLPLFAERTQAGGVEVTRVAFLGDGATGCDYLDVLAGPGHEGDVLELTLAALGAQQWDLLDLDGVSRESATAAALAARFASRRWTGSEAGGLGNGPDVLRDGRLRYVCPHIPLTGTWEAYLESHARRENLRRREKWLFKQPGTSISVAKTEAECARALDDFLTLHHARWSVDGGSDGIPDAAHEAFHRAVVPVLAQRGWLRFYTLFAARRPVASVYGVVYGGKFNYYQSGYDPLWGSRSVGMVLLARTVQDAFAEGLTEFDFLRGNEPYKFEWARGERWTVQLRLWRGTRARVARAAEEARVTAREAMKKVVPPGALEGMRKVRRVLRGPAPQGRLRAVLGALSKGEREE